MPEHKTEHYFVQIRNYVEDKINTGEFATGEQIPTEVELAGQFGVSRLTVKRALTELVERKLLYRVKGKGTFVHTAARQSALAEAGGVPSVPGGAGGPGGHEGPGSSGVPGSLAGHAAAAGARDIAVIMPDMYSSYANAMIHAIHHAFEEAGYSLRLYLTQESYEREKQAILNALAAGVSGMIIFPARRQTYNEELVKLALRSFPHVLIDRYLRGIDNYCVYSDNFGGAYAVVNELAAKGHRHIAVISPTTDGTTSIEDRIAGVQAAVTDNTDAHIRMYPFYLLEDQFGTMLTEEPDEEIIGQIAAFLAQHGQVTAMLGMNLSAAAGAVYAAEQLGRAIPGQLLAVTFDKPEFLRLLRVPLAYVEQDAQQIGDTASRTLLRIIGGEDAPKVQKIATKLQMN